MPSSQPSPASEAAVSSPRPPLRQRLYPNGEHVLAAALALEILVFALLARNFWTVANLWELIRSSTELGLVALAETAVILTGGIDLSVGSMLGLAAVTFGAIYNLGAPLWLAIALTLLAGLAGGALNAVLIAWVELPSLIVTLGTYSMYRGIAEGITHGAINYSGFPIGFLHWGQGLTLGVPLQLPLFALVYLGYYVLVHRSAAGRALYAIGLSPAGARYAGLPVRRRTAMVYLLAGVVSALAGIVYVAHLGQAPSSAGSGYELDAITAVVLGGASIFGGRGTLWGTLLGLYALVILQNGLQLAALPSELTGVLTGVLLVAVLSLDWFRSRRAARPPAGVQSPPLGEELDVKNSQVAILCATFIAGALIVAGTNVWLVRTLRAPAGAGAGTPAAAAVPAGRELTIAVMPKDKGDPYFASCRTGAVEAAKQLGVNLIWDGPTSLDPAKQNVVAQDWITRHVNAMAVAVGNSAGISPVLKQARAAGIGVVTWDSDAAPDSRDYFVNQATSQAIGTTLADEGARLEHGTGQYAIITGALSAQNQNEWIAYIKQRMAAAHPQMQLATVLASNDDRDQAFSQTQTIMKVYPKVKMIIVISAPAVPGAGEAIRQSGRKDVDVIGLSLPSICRPYIKDGSVKEIVLWNTHDLGYATVYAADLVAQHAIPAGATSIQAGRLGTLKVEGTQIILGPPLVINLSNVDQFDF